jgi:hypothetical protein
MEKKTKWEILDVDNSKLGGITHYTSDGIKWYLNDTEFINEHKLDPMTWALANYWEPYATGATWRHIFRKKIIEDFTEV